MNVNLMPHQNRALDLTEYRNRVAYYLDMGLGKTFVGAEKMYLLNNDINLLICQKSKIEDWVEHFKTYYPDYEVFNLTKKCQAIRFREITEIQPIYWVENERQIVGVINYELAFRRSYISHLKHFTLMLDESSLIQNENAKRSKFILKLKPESVVLLSGTPTAGKYERLWSQCHLLGWDITKKAFWNSYVETEWIETGAFKQEVVTGYKHVEHLKKKLAEYGAVFMKTEEVIDLPEQVEQYIKVENTKEYRYFMKNNYLVLDTLNLVQYKNPYDSDIDPTPRVELIGDNSLTKILYARQLCGQYHRDKLEAFKDLIESTEDRLIVFYNFNEELRQLRSICESLGREVSFVNGSGRSMYAYECVQNSVTFIQYQAGAMGGNFQKANKIIYFTLPLGKGSCDMWEQSKKRIHRIGQKKTCFYYYLLVKGSFEERNLKMLREGKEYTDELFKEQNS